MPKTKTPTDADLAADLETVTEQRDAAELAADLETAIEQRDAAELERDELIIALETANRPEPKDIDATLGEFCNAMRACGAAGLGMLSRFHVDKYRDALRILMETK